MLSMEGGVPELTLSEPCRNEGISLDPITVQHFVGCFGPMAY